VAREVAGLRAAADERARAAELDRVRAEGERAKAEAEAREQRKRRRVQAGLGMTLTAVVALVGFGLWWNERHESEAAANRASRQSRTVASVSAALDDARARIGEAWALADEPDMMRAANDLALDTVRRAEGFADSGEPPPDTLNELAAVRAAAADLDRHTRLFVAADLAIQSHDIGADGHPDAARTAGKLREAFREFGWDPIRAPAAEIAAEIAASRVRNKVLGFLCDWEYHLRSRDLPDHDKVTEVIRTARRLSGGLLAEWQRVRDARDPARLAAFAAGPEVLTLGPELLCALGRNLQDARFPDARLTLMRRAVYRFPTHVWLNVDLMHACLDGAAWKNAEAFRAAAAAAHARPNSAQLQKLLGMCFLNLGDYDQAAACCRKAIALAPTYGGAYDQLAFALTRAGDREGPLTVYREFVRQAPNSALAHSLLGSALLAKGGRDEAIAELREALRLDPRHFGSHQHLAKALADKGDVDGAIAEYREMIRLNPLFGETHLKLARLLQRNGDLEGAIVSMREAIRLDPKSDLPRNELAWLLATGPDRVRDGKQAVEHATHACEVTGGLSVRHIDTLAAAYAEAGDFDRAVEFQSKALALPAFDKEYGKRGRMRLELYTQKKPYRDPAFVPREVAPPPRTVKLVGGKVCVPATSDRFEDGLHRVTLPGGALAWVRVLAPQVGSAA
jgi:tetratricopeptide (TPR) repeat protein